MKNSYLQRIGQLALTVCLPLTTPAAKETIVLVNGTSLVGDVTAGPNGKLVIKDSVLGVLTIDANAVKTRHAADGAAEKPPVVPTAGKPPTDPNKVVWTRGLQLNYSYISGAAPALGVGSNTNFGANLAIERAARKDIVSFTASYNRGHNRPGPVSVNNRTFGLQYDHLYSEKVRFISQSTFLVDHPHKIDHSFKQLAAVGYTFVKSPKAFLLVAPGVGYTYQKEFVGSAEKDFGYGAYETASYAFTKALSIEQRAYYLGAFDTADSYHYTGYLGLKGQVTPSVAMTIGFNIVHDNQPAPGIEKTDYQLMSGLQLKF
ncbi:MAG: DUF481 domain-containing protein [Opitutaceae bacterium]|nr:DUF481 domain-containing protein [Opitutaceae bacterium]